MIPAKIKTTEVTLDSGREELAMLAIASTLVENGCAHYVTDSGKPVLKVVGGASSVMEKTVDYVNQSLSENAKAHKDRLADLSKNTSFVETEETEVVLLHRFTRKRDDFLRQHQFVDNRDMAALLGRTGANVARTMQNLRDKDQILYFKQDDGFRYPVFQLDREGSVIEEILTAIERAKSAGRSNWDICFWLFEEQLVTVKQAHIAAGDLTDVSLEEALTLGECAQQQTESFQGKPVDVIKNGEQTLFEQLLDDWLIPDNRDIASAMLQVESTQGNSDAQHANNN